MHGHVAYALFMGPGLILAAANEAWLLLARLTTAPIGMPLAEAFVDEERRHIRRAMFHAYRCGCPVRMRHGDGVLWIIPYVDPAGRRGVVSRYQPTLVPLEEPVPALPLTV